MFFQALGVLVLSMAGCDEDKPRAAPTDASVADRSTDGGGSGDADVPDAGSDAGSAPTGCSVDLLIDLGTAVASRQRQIAIASSETGFAVAWDQPDPDENVLARFVPLTGDPSDRVPVAADIFLAASPAVVATDGGFLVAWYDNRESGFEVYVQTFDAALGAPGMPVRVTDNTNRDDEPGLLVLGSTVLASWVEDDMVALTRVGRTRVLSAAGMPTAAARAITMAPDAPSRPVLAARDGGALATWVAGGDVVSMPLDATGAPAGARTVLSTESNAAGVVDLALDATGGAAIFDVAVGGARSEVRFRRLDAAGAAAAPEAIVTVAPEVASGPSIAKMPVGYVASYRALGDDGLASPVIRIALLRPEGDVLGTLDVAPAHVDGGPTTVRVTPDGRTLLVAWADRVDADTFWSAARLRCE